jgi:hypothetical protein
VGQPDARQSEPTKNAVNTDTAGLHGVFCFVLISLTAEGWREIGFYGFVSQ